MKLELLNKGFSRRRFIEATGLCAVSCSILHPSSICAAEMNSELLIAPARGQELSRRAINNKRFFRFAVIADTHIIDDFYKGPEGSPLDTETIFKTSARLEKARALINNLNPPVEQVFLVGDYIHDYPSIDYDFYFKNRYSH
ncbi:MAG: hypothetical protein WKF84_01430 [Pyrinomonadaceae bacterium]